MTIPLKELLAKASKLPIEFNRGNDGIRAFRLSADGLIIADILYSRHREVAPANDQAKANAALLAHSANVIEGLVDAAKRFVEAQGHVERLRTTSCGEKLEHAEADFIDAWHEIKAALANAEAVEI